MKIKSQGSPLVVKEHENLIKVIIAPKLQQQLKWLCEKISDLEWSGTLFYTVNGDDFNHPDFKIVAEELYLQDIGTSTYTEYGVTPEYIKVLMENPQLRTMKKGHIHSHNHMTVFFSGTDDSELVDNSPFHNYYLSLIVNNRNHMEAKIAYRAKVKTETVITKSYKNLYGADTEDVNLEEESENVMFVYKTKIVKPYAPDELLKQRYLFIKDKREKSQLIQEKSKGRNFDIDSSLDRIVNARKSSTNIYDRSAGSLDFQPLSKQLIIFEDMAPKRELKHYPSPDSQSTKVDYNSMECFLIDYLGKGIQNQTLTQVLGNLNKRVTRKKITVVEHILEIQESLFKKYYKHFNSGVTNQENWKSTMDELIKFLNKNFRNNYAYLVDKLICHFIALKSRKWK